MWILCFLALPIFFVAITLCLGYFVGAVLLQMPTMALQWIIIYAALYSIAVLIIWGTIYLSAQIEGRTMSYTPKSILVPLLLTLVSPIMMFVMGIGCCLLVTGALSIPVDDSTFFFLGGMTAAVLTFLVTMGCIWYVSSALRTERCRQKLHSSTTNPQKG